MCTYIPQLTWRINSLWYFLIEARDFQSCSTVRLEESMVASCEHLTKVGLEEKVKRVKELVSFREATKEACLKNQQLSVRRVKEYEELRDKVQCTYTWYCTNYSLLLCLIVVACCEGHRSVKRGDWSAPTRPHVVGDAVSGTIRCESVGSNIRMAYLYTGFDSFNCTIKHTLHEWPFLEYQSSLYSTFFFLQEASKDFELNYGDMVSSFKESVQSQYPPLPVYVLTCVGHIGVMFSFVMTITDITSNSSWPLANLPLASFRPNSSLWPDSLSKPNLYPSMI